VPQVLAPLHAEQRYSCVAAVLQSRAEDVAERSARVGRTELCDGFLLFGDFQRLDRQLDLAGLLRDLDARVDLLADGETLRTLVVTVTDRSARRMKEVMSVWLTSFTSMPPSLTAVTSAGQRRPFLMQVAGSIGRRRVLAELLDAERDALLLDVDVENQALTMSPLLYSSMTCSPGRFQSRSERWTMPSTSPSRPMNRPNSVLFLTSPSTSRAGRVLLGEAFPRVGKGLLETERDTALLRIDFEHDTSTSWRGETILPGWTFFLVQLISETWIRPSMPGSSSTNAP
jgi:hypothetical protein